MSKYRQFIYYVGTSCDNKKLRTKLKRLQDKLFKNILIQKESILLFFKRFAPYILVVLSKLADLNRSYVFFFLQETYPPQMIKTKSNVWCALLWQHSPISKRLCKNYVILVVYFQPMIVS